MTEAEWWAGLHPTWGTVTPHHLLDWLFYDAWASDRKLRLFCLACCRRLARRFGDWPHAGRVDLLERFVEGQSSDSFTRDQILAEYIDPSPDAPPRGPHTARWCADLALCKAFSVMPETRDRDYLENQPEYAGTYPDEVVWQLGFAIEDAGLGTSAAEHVAVVTFLHDIFGPLPFRDVAVAPAWFTSDVLALAKGIYDEKAFDRMPILADALQDAGCDNDEILSHCRATQWEHVRGCWVIDLLLGKPWREERPAPG